MHQVSNRYPALSGSSHNPVSRSPWKYKTVELWSESLSLEAGGYRACASRSEFVELFSSGVFPSLQRRGGCGINKKL
jgi:hypothetical protein